MPTGDKGIGARKEAGIDIQLTKDELAGLNLGPDAPTIDGLKVRLKPIAKDAANHPAVQNSPADAVALGNLLASLGPLETELFQRMQSDAAFAKRFVRDPANTLGELKSLDAQTHKNIISLARALGPKFAMK